MKKIRCDKCGYELFPMDTVCESCGTKVTRDHSIPSAGSIKNTYHAGRNDEDKHSKGMGLKKKKRTLIILGCCAGILLCIGVINQVWEQKSKRVSHNTNEAEEEITEPEKKAQSKKSSGEQDIKNVSQKAEGDKSEASGRDYDDPGSNVKEAVLQPSEEDMMTEQSPEIPKEYSGNGSKESNIFSEKPEAENKINVTASYPEADISQPPADLQTDRVDTIAEEEPNDTKSESKIDNTENTVTHVESEVERAINATTLNPFLTRSQQTNDLVITVLNQIITEDMTTFQKVRACHDYLVYTCSYGNRGQDVVVIDDNTMEMFPDMRDFFAYNILSTHIGVCDEYTSAFVALTRAIGLDSYYTSGQTHKASGGFTYHAWAVIFAGGQEYVFDPQIDDNLTKGGQISYIRFGKKYDEVPGKYIPSGIYECVSSEHEPERGSWF